MAHPYRVRHRVLSGFADARCFAPLPSVAPFRPLALESREYNRAVMVRFILYLALLSCLCLVHNTSNAQNFIKKYNFGLQGLVFSDIITDYTSDHIILYGYGLDTLQNNGYGFFIARLDTSGNLVAYDVHYLDNNEIFGYTPNRDIILDGNGGYIGTGNSLTNNAGVVAKFNQDLSLAFLKEYPVTDNGYLYDTQFAFSHGGNYFLLGRTGYLDGSMIPFIHKVDADGNLIWTKKYKDVGAYCIGEGTVKIDDEEFVIYGKQQPTYVTPDSYYAQAWMISIDTSGQELWSWESDTSQLDFGLSKLLLTQDGWVGINIKVEWGSPGYARVLGGIIRLDENKEVVWNTPLGAGQPFTGSGWSAMYDIAQTIDSNWVAVGELLVDSINARAAWMVGVSPEGDSLWGRTDTLRHVTGTVYHSGLHGVVVMPSGSIVAAGRTRHPNGRYYGLLIKTDPRGCITPDCHPYMSIFDATDDNADDFEFSLSPNPTSGLLQVTCGGVTPFSAEVYDGTGRVLADRKSVV